MLVEVGVIDGFVVVADDGIATDGDRNMAMVVAILHLAVVATIGFHKVGTHRSQTTTAIDGAEHSAAAEVDIDVAAHHACGEGHAGETTTATKHVAVHVGTTRRADDGMEVHITVSGIPDDNQCVANHVTVFTATEDGAVDDAACHIHIGVDNVGLGVEDSARVALACAEEVAGDGVTGDLFEITRHTQGTTIHLDSGIAIHQRVVAIPILEVLAHAGDFVTAIHRGKDVTTGDFDRGVASYTTRRRVPNGLVLTISEFLHVRIVT